MPRMEPQQTLKRAEAAWKIKHQWRALLSDAYALALPMRNPFLDNAGAQGKQTMQPGREKMDRVFDSTLMNSTVRLANRLQTELTPPFQRWGKLVAGPMIPKNFIDEINEELEGIRRVMFTVIWISNFDTAVNEF